jgi:hypothetical protein
VGPAPRTGAAAPRGLVRDLVGDLVTGLVVALRRWLADQV